MTKSLLRSLALVALTSPALAQPAETSPADPVEVPAEPVPADPAPAEPAAPATDAAPTDAAAEAAAEADAEADDELLASLGLDPDAPTFDDKLQIYGFADFSYFYNRYPGAVLPDARSFSVGNVNLYARKNLSPSWRTLTEVRLLFAPNGSMPAQGIGLELQSTEVTDAANFERPIAWGGISIERVHVEHDIAPWLTIRAGRFLTPYGIWNIDHGSPVIIGVSRPYIVGEQFFPEHQTGLQLFGTKTVDDYRFEYHGTVSNGRNTFEATRDVDKKLAFGGRLAVTAPLAGTLALGVSAYRGRASAPTSLTDIGPAYDETALGADAAWDRGRFHAQAELLVQDRRYLDGRRALSTTGFAPDGRAFGMYALAGYRFNSLWNVMPYGLVQHYTPHDPTFVGKTIIGLEAGVNLRPIPSIVLKATYVRAMFGDDGLLAGSGDFFATQVAWVF